LNLDIVASMNITAGATEKLYESYMKEGRYYCGQVSSFHKLGNKLAHRLCMEGQQ